MQTNEQRVVAATPEPALVPSAVVDVVERPALAARVARRPVTLLQAPTGYGKTTLLAEWRRGETRRVAWLTLEPPDGDPDRLCARVGAMVGVSASGAAAGDAVTQLVNHLDRCDPLAIVLDDVHVLAGSRAEPALDRLIEYLPPSTRLILAGRTAPALRLTALAASGRLEILRPAQLELEPAEVIWLARRVAPAPPSRSQLRGLVDAAEGWPAGAYLLARALGRGGRARRDVGDYLREEVVDQLSREERDFVLQTSVLDRLTAHACDVLLDRHDSGEMLAGLVELGVMLVPDGNGGVRYHPLLAELLRDELARGRPALARLLRGRAAEIAADDVPHRHPAADDELGAASCAAYACALYLAGRTEEALASAARVGMEGARRAPEATATCFAIRSLAYGRLGRPTAAAAAARTSVAIAPGALGLLALAEVRRRAGGAAAARQSLEAALGLACGHAAVATEILGALASLTQGDAPAAAPGRRDGSDDLSPAELRVLRLLAGTLTQREIGRELYLARNTVKTHVGAAYRKLGVRSRADAVQRARRLNLIPPG